MRSESEMPVGGAVRCSYSLDLGLGIHTYIHNMYRGHWQWDCNWGADMYILDGWIGSTYLGEVIYQTRIVNRRTHWQVGRCFLMWGNLKAASQLTNTLCT